MIWIHINNQGGIDCIVNEGNRPRQGNEIVIFCNYDYEEWEPNGAEYFQFANKTWTAQNVTVSAQRQATFNLGNPAMANSYFLNGNQYTIKEIRIPAEASASINGGHLLVSIKMASDDPNAPSVDNLSIDIEPTFGKFRTLVTQDELNAMLYWKNEIDTLVHDFEGIYSISLDGTELSLGSSDYDLKLVGNGETFSYNGAVVATEGWVGDNYLPLIGGTLTGNLTVNGVTTLSGYLMANGDSYINGKSYFAQLASFTNGISVASGGASIGGDVTVSGKATFNGGVEVNGNSLYVRNGAQLLADASSYISWYGASNFYGNETHYGAETHTGDETHNGTATFKSKIYADGGIDVYSNAGTKCFTVSGNTMSIFSSLAQFSGGESHSGNEQHTGAETHSGTETHSGSETHNGAVTFENAVTANGAVTFNNGFTSAGNVIFNEIDENTTAQFNAATYFNKNVFTEKPLVAEGPVIFNGPMVAINSLVNVGAGCGFRFKGSTAFFDGNMRFRVAPSSTFQVQCDSEFTHSVSVGQNLTVTGNASIGGDLTVSGTITSVDAETLSVGTRYIQMMKGNTVAVAGFVGSVIPKYDGTNDFFFGVKEDTMVLGDVTATFNSDGDVTGLTDISTVPLMAREGSAYLDDGDFLIWDATGIRAVGIGAAAATNALVFADNEDIDALFE